MRILRKNLVWLVLAAIAAAIFCVGTWVTPAYRLATGSMTPTLPVGSIVFTHHESTYKPGEIITFHADGGQIVTHRLVKITKSGEFITKGDANPSRDYWHNPVTKSDVVGKVIRMTPILTLAFWSSLRGIGIIILVAAFLLGWYLYKREEEESTKRPAHRLDKSPA